MEEKKLDLNSIIGFVLIGAILIWVLYQNRPTPEEAKREKQKQEQTLQNQSGASGASKEKENDGARPGLLTSTETVSRFGVFAPSARPFSATPDTLTLENELVELKITSRGGQIVSVKMKKYTDYNANPVYLVNGTNALFNLRFKTADGKAIDTKELYFYPELSKEGADKILSLKLQAAQGAFLEYRYVLKPADYLVDFTIRSQGWEQVADRAEPVLDWKLKGIRQAKSITYENRYTRLTYRHEGDKIAKLGAAGNDTETGNAVRWISYRQHFFSAILAADTPFKTAALASQDLVKEEDSKAMWTKRYTASVPLEPKGGELNYNLYWYYGPTHFAILKKYKDLKLADSIPFGWGIFGWINRHVFTPLFEGLSSFLPYGIAIIVMTIIVRLILSPITYKSYLSQVKMKVLRPEIMEVNEKYKDEPMKRQQETMKIYSKAGVSPMSGCVPALLQLPIFYALFMFFPTAFVLRQKGFLWAEDLSAYDTVATLPFKIPFYGDHVSLFPILASAAIFVYMQMTSSQTAQMQQPGMPNMKFILYLSPVLMLFFFNNYASGLSLYYFISNLITILIMLAIKQFIIDETKIHAQIEENKKKPKKESRLQRKMREMMEQAQAQQKTRKKK